MNKKQIFVLLGFLIFSAFCFYMGFKKTTDYYKSEEIDVSKYDYKPRPEKIPQDTTDYSLEATEDK